ncbi:hypothetical protein [Nocardioides conyzicola]
MRRTLGTVLLLLALVGCGSDSDPGSSAGSGGSDGAPQVTTVAMLTGTSAGGVVTTRPTPVADEAAAREYGAGFRNDRLQGEIVDAVAGADVPAGKQLALAVVAIGCEVPTKVVGTGTADAVTLRAVLPSPTKECFAPITTVALVLLPA